MASRALSSKSVSFSTSFLALPFGHTNPTSRPTVSLTLAPAPRWGSRDLSPALVAPLLLQGPPPPFLPRTTTMFPALPRPAVPAAQRGEQLLRSSPAAPQTFLRGGQGLCNTASLAGHGTAPPDRSRAPVLGAPETRTHLAPASPPSLGLPRAADDGLPRCPVNVPPPTRLRRTPAGQRLLRPGLHCT